MSASFLRIGVLAATLGVTGTTVWGNTFVCEDTNFAMTEARSAAAAAALSTNLTDALCLSDGGGGGGEKGVFAVSTNIDGFFNFLVSALSMEAF